MTFRDGCLSKSTPDLEIVVPASIWLFFIRVQCSITSKQFVCKIERSNEFQQTFKCNKQV